MHFNYKICRLEFDITKTLNLMIYNNKHPHRSASQKELLRFWHYKLKSV